jgi:hypothetical protein
MKPNKNILLIFSFVLVFSSCGKIEQMSPIPHIEFTSFTVTDSSDALGNREKAGKLLFYFEDGDGDMGFDDPRNEAIDTTKVDSLKNMFIDSYRKVNGKMVKITNEYDPVKAYSYWRIPYMEKTGQNKLLKGTISLSILYSFYNTRDSDIVRYDLYIVDRNNNISDTISTCEIPLSKNGIYKK